ncbi:hypothetical protein ACO2KH_17725 [Leptospira terpstrae]|uniref:hypothetical protein n=1 Tax=Leptospira terpstrae TaxID=293075 RepID=UPI003D01898B
MSKKIIWVFNLTLSSIALYCFLLLSCAPKEGSAKESWFVSLLSLSTPFLEDKKIPETLGSGFENSYFIRSISPNIVMENSNFLIEGENLSHLTEKQLFGDEYSKFLQFTEVTDSKITVSLHLCPDSPFVLQSTGNTDSNSLFSIPCLGPFRHSIRSLKFVLGIPMEPISPNYSGNSLDLLRSLGEIEFVIDSPVSAGIQLHPVTGVLLGTPTETTENEFRFFTVSAQLKTNPNLRIQTSFQYIVVTDEEKTNRTCRSISQTSTCMLPSPHVCSNSSQCFTSRFACEMNAKCGF